MRLQKRLQRGGLDCAPAVAAGEAGRALARGRWDLMVWSASRIDASLAELIRRDPERVPVLMVLPEGSDPSAAAAALDAGVGDVMRAENRAVELVPRARALARRARSLAALRTEAVAFRELADGGRDILARHAPDGVIRYVSSAARDVTGREASSFVGRRMTDLFPPETLEAVSSPYLHRLRREDGLWVWMETTARVVEDASGRTLEILTASREVTSRVRADAERAAIARVSAAVAEVGPLEALAEIIARETATLVDAEDVAIVRFQGDEGIVLAAAGAKIRPGDRVPLLASAAGGLGAHVVVEARLWGMVLARGLGTVGALGERAGRLERLAALMGLGVSNTRSRERLVARATTDPLTSLANHGAFHRRLEQECARAERSGSPVTLVLIDLDHFKRVNDRHGHQVGDDVLREVSRRLRGCARHGDVPARVGGEELAWLLPDADLAEGLEAAERLRRRIADTEFATVGRLTASLGVATLGPGGPADLLRRADEALYRAKAAGRNACVAARAVAREAPSS